MYSVLAPMVKSVSPNSGPGAGGTTVTITGQNFLAGALVFFGTVSSQTVTVASATQIQAVTPRNAAGAADVTVENPGGQSAKLSGGFSYTTPSTSGPPTISSASPNSGPSGTQVTITGTNFESGATVAFGGTGAASTIFVSSTELKGSVPAMGAGTYDVAVTNPDPGKATLPGGFTVTAPPPTRSLLAGMTPANLKVPGGWALALTQDFESGSIGPHEFGKQSTSGVQDQVSTTIAHSGTHSWRGVVSGDGSSTSWGLNGASYGVTNEVYASWYAYLDPTARATIESNFFRASDPAPGTGCGTTNIPQMTFDTQNYSNPVIYTATSMTIQMFPQDGCGVDNTNIGQAQWNLNLGTWEQEEAWVKVNTCTGGVPNKDGFYRFYINGVLRIQNNAISWGSCWSGQGLQIEVGGTWTYQYATNASNQCVAFTDPTAVHTPTANLFTDAPRFEKDGVTPCVGSIPTFNKYVDDIIVLHR